MKSTLLLIVIFVCSHINATAQIYIPNTPGTWQGGVGLGNIPIRGSFKTSFTGGYNFTEKLYVGVIYQIRDEIKKGTSSFNAKSSDLGGLSRSTSYIAPRIFVHGRYTPFEKLGAFVTGGFVYNGRSYEFMSYDVRNRNISGDGHTGSMTIEQIRPAGWRVALGIGYQHYFSTRLSASAEWAPAWFQFPKPSYKIKGLPNLTEEEHNEITSTMNNAFKKRFNNMYNVIHIGVAYHFNI